MKNIILITIDCLRPDFLGCYGYNENTSPNINELAGNGVKFENAFSTAPFTPASFPSILAGIYPLQYGSYTHLPKEAKTLAEVLNKRGFKTAGFHSNGFLSSYYGYGRGFDYFEDYLISDRHKFAKFLRKNKILFGLVKKAYSSLKSIKSKFEKKKKKINHPYVKAEKQTKDAINWLADNEKDFFLWIHYMDPHGPLVSTKKHREKITDIKKEEIEKLNQKHSKVKAGDEEYTQEEMEKIKKLYEAEISYVDEEVGKLTEFLKEENLFDDTIIIITADHGEEFYEHGGVDHTAKLYDTLVKVPLILANVDKEVNEKNLVSLTDIGPSLTRLLDLKKPKNWKGTDIFSSKREHVFFETTYLEKNRDPPNKFRFETDKKQFLLRGIRTKEWKYIEDEKKGEKLFNLEKDPEEKNNLADGKYSETKNRLKTRMKNELVKKEEKINEIDF